MLIYRCDNCGREAQLPRIVGNEFAASKHGFGTLAVPAGKARDLCKVCMAKAEGAFNSVPDDTFARRNMAVAAAMDGGRIVRERESKSILNAVLQKLGLR